MERFVICRRGLYSDGVKTIKAKLKALKLPVQVVNLEGLNEFYCTFRLTEDERQHYQQLIDALIALFIG